jgi:hypothetical protein
MPFPHHITDLPHHIADITECIPVVYRNIKTASYEHLINFVKDAIPFKVQC